MSNNEISVHSHLAPPPALIPELTPGLVFVVSAPAGAGKTSLVYRMLSWFPSLALSVTYTTRKPRKGETHGIDYHFISSDEFQQRIEMGDFLEYVELHGNRYGSSRSSIETLAGQGKHVIMVIDTEGAKRVKELMQPVMIFIRPPSIDVLKARLSSRGSESKESFEMRMKRAEHELSCEPMYDYSIVNEDFDLASLTLASVIAAEVHKKRHERAFG